MTKSIIESVVGADYFILNGIQRPRAYEAIGVNLLQEKKGVKIIAAHRDDTLPIQETILFDEYMINDYVPTSQDECISLLNEIVFKKGGGNGGGVAGDLIIPIGKMLRFKVEGGPDFCLGFVEGTFIQADLIGDNPTQLSSYDLGDV